MSRAYLNDLKSFSLEDRKRAILTSTSFIQTVEQVLESSARISGTIASFRSSLPKGVRGVYAASLRSVSIPMNFATNLYTRTFNVTYTNVGPWPGDIVIPIGNFYYSINAGTVTYADATPHPTSNNLLYFILNYFNGALASLSVNPQSGAITWDWDAATGGVTSTDVPAWFNLQTTTGLAWISNGNPIDLSGVKTIGVIIPDLSSQSSKSNVVPIPGYFATIPVNVGFGQVLAYEPQREDICWLGANQDLSSMTVQLVDTATNVVLPMVTDWNITLRLYVSKEQTN
jgi:hypothetical protein